MEKLNLTQADRQSLQDCVRRLREGVVRRGLTEKGNWILLGVPAWNEAGALPTWLSEVPDSVGGFTVVPVLVDDGSTDGTGALAVDAGWTVLSKERNQGLAHSIFMLFELARSLKAPALVTMDGDGQHACSELQGFIASWRAGEQLVTGSRYLGKTQGQSVLRTRGLQGISLILSALVGRRILDPACGFRLYSAHALEYITVSHRRHYAAETLIRAVLAGVRVNEIPVTIQRRTAGASKQGMTILYGARFTWVLLQTWWSARKELRVRPKRLEVMHGA